MSDNFGIKLFPSDGKVVATVHYGDRYNNRFWDGKQLVIGDGDGTTFAKFSGLDTVAGALVYSIIQEKTQLLYQGQSGALITHISDTIAAMVGQYHQEQKADSADWLIGSDVFSPNVKGALRSMKAPGTAFDNKIMGKDPQPAHMKDYVKTTQDSGGVHLNSGIPNHAFYLAAVAVGGSSWDKIGAIWMKSMDHIANPNTNFVGFASITFQTAQSIYGDHSSESKAVAQAWSEVGISLAKETTSESNTDHTAK